MLWLLFLFMVILAAVIGLTAPSPEAAIGFIFTLAWITLLLYIILFRKDEITKILEG